MRSKKILKLVSLRLALLTLTFISFFNGIETFGQHKSLIDKFSFSMSKGDKPAADSLLLRLKSNKEDTDSSMAFYQHALALKSYYKGTYNEAKSHFLTAARYYDNANLPFRHAAVLNNAAVCLFFQDSLSEAYSMHLKVKKIREKKNDPKISSTYNNLGLVLMQLKRYDEAIRHFKKSNKLKIESGDSIKLSNSYNNMGICYKYLNKYDSSKYFYDRALELAENHEQQRMIDNALNNLSSLHFELGNMDSARYYIEKSINSKKTLNNEKSQARSYILLSRLYLNDNQLQKSKSLIDSLENQLLRSEEENIYELEMLYSVKTSIAKKQSNYEKALTYQNRRFDYYKKYLKKEQARTIDSLQTTFEVAEKNKKIDSLSYQSKLNHERAEKEHQRAQNIRIILLISVISLAIIIIFFYLNYKQRQKIQRFNDQLEDQNELQRHLLGTLSHDLKNSVYANHQIANQIYQQIDQLNIDSLRKYLEDLSKDTEKTAHTLNEIISWISVSLKNKSNRAYIGDIIQELVQRYHEHLQENRIKVNVTLQHPKTVVNEDIIKLLSRNILDNLLKHSKSSSFSFKDELKDSVYRLQIIEAEQNWGTETLKILNADTYKADNSMGIVLIHSVLPLINGEIVFFNQSNSAVCEIKFPVQE